jgi:GABA(A) receptor-associated protein
MDNQEPKKQRRIRYAGSHPKSFKEKYTEEERRSEANKIRRKYTDRIPIICERSTKSNIELIDKNKYLVPSDLTVGQFTYIIRKRIKISPEKAIFLLVNNTYPSTSTTMGELYNEYKSDDYFLYCTYAGENVFGFQFKM